MCCIGFRVNTIMTRSVLLFLVLIWTSDAVVRPRNIDTSPPAQPVLTLSNQTLGIQAEWSVDSIQPITYSHLVYTDSHNRIVEHAVNNGLDRDALLLFVQPCETYTAIITSENAFGTSQPSTPAVIQRDPIDAPLPPTAVNVTTSASGHLVTWFAPNGSTPFSRYLIIGQDVDTGDLIEQYVAYNELESKLEKFDQSRSFNIQLFTENSCNRSIPTAELYLPKFSVPTKPTISDVIPQDGKIKVTFEPGSTTDKIDYYMFEYDTPNAMIEFRSSGLPLPTETILVAQITECHNYTGRIWAVNAAGTSEVAPFSGFSLSPSIPIINADPIIDTTNGYKLSWVVETNAARPVMKSIIEYTIESSKEKFMDWIMGSSTEAYLTRISQCNKYTIGVRSGNSCGWSTWNNTAVIDLPPYVPPSAPASFAVDSITSSQAVLTWTAVPVDATSHRQYDLLVVSPEAGMQNYWLDPSTATVTLTNLTPLTEFTVLLRSENVCGWSGPAKQTFKTLPLPEIKSDIKETRPETKMVVKAE